MHVERPAINSLLAMTTNSTVQSSTRIFITGRNEVVAKVMFLQVCVCPQGGRVSASVHAGMPYPPPPEPDTHTRTRGPPGTRETPQKQTPAYSLRAAGTHPTGMHSCSQCNFVHRQLNDT